MNVLIVDDDVSSAVSIKRLLELEKMNVVIYTDPVKALNEYMVGSFDAVISDFRMPELTGIDFFKRLKEKEKRAKFFLITGYSDIDLDITDTTELIDYFFNKPLNVEKFISTIIKVVRS